MPFNISSSLKTSYTTSLSPAYITRHHTSWLLPPLPFALLRAFLSLYILLVRIIVLALESTDAKARDTSYFTNLTYWGLGFYFAFAALHSASYARNGRIWLESWPEWLRWADSALYATVTVYPFVVTIVYWSLLSSPSSFSNPFTSWSNTSQHILNSLFALSEILLPRSDPHPWILLAPVIGCAAAYLGLAYLSHATQHVWVYNFLNPRIGNGLVAGACIGIAVGLVIVFALVRYLMLLRQWVTEVKLGMSGKLGRSRDLDLLPITEHGAKSGTEMDDGITPPVVLIELDAK